MSRKTRMYLPGIQGHVVQRGHNRDACFFAGDDYQFYLECFGQGLRRAGRATARSARRPHATPYFLNHACMRFQPSSAGPWR
jgi:putative transposase